jgi:hypothetical protein
MSKGVRGAVIELVAMAFGWAVCFGMLVGAWGLGWWIASEAASDLDRNVFGLLSALAFLWMYERREAHERYNHLCERLVKPVDGERQ